MQKLDRSTLHSLEEYATIRDEFRREVIAHKKPRRIAVTPNAVFYFEDFTTMKYQAQEMLRAERIFEADGIQDEIDAYNPLIPDGNFKATFMLEYADAMSAAYALASSLASRIAPTCRSATSPAPTQSPMRTSSAARRRKRLPTLLPLRARRGNDCGR